MPRSAAAGAPPGRARAADRRPPSARRDSLLLVSAEVPRHFRRAEDAVDMTAFVEALVGQELEVRRIFGVHAAGHLALEVADVPLQRRKDLRLVAAEERLHEHGCMPEIR